MPGSQTISTAPTRAELLARLESFDALRAYPRTELEWIVTRGEYRRCQSGEVVLSCTEESQEMIVQLSGRITVYFGHGAGRRHVAESKGGSITGLLPFSRLKRPPTDVLAEEAAEFIAVHRRMFPEMQHACPVLVESLVHNMLDRARRFAAADWQDEKVMSLGRLAAGLAHELNNPAAAASSGVVGLASTVRELAWAAHEFGMTTLSNAQRALVSRAVEQCQSLARTETRSIMERSQLEDGIAEWLGQHGIDDSLSVSLVDGGVSKETLVEVAASVEGKALQRAVRWIAATAAATTASADVLKATRRIQEVVSAVRDFSHMDRAMVREPTSVASTLTETVKVFRLGTRAKGVTITLDMMPALPDVSAVAPDLNQVWSHLIENALDAAGESGLVQVSAMLEGHTVVVAITDNGPGIPRELQSRIFDPFFTTKPVGQGIGLGLDTVRRTVRDFDGEVEFDSQPGRTEFRVRLPALRS